ncbi:TRAP transporter substrate-binding protein DctP [Corynebacterium nuruki]|uniref:TRAP transporter substrate-binding protein n=1 Tax=Corynebacterium nuruki TaxID=1032851 RepID=UPI001111E4F5|nr:TRAP transporter substrate-binding protein DctP [Corynebacterium nuruki]
MTKPPVCPTRGSLGRPRGAVTATVAAVTAATAVFATTSCSSPAEGETDTVTLTMADNFALTHPVGVGGTRPFLDRIEDTSDLDINYFASGQLGHQADMPTVIRNGTADIGVVSAAYAGSNLPLSGVSDLPGFGNDACQVGYALRDVARPGGILYEKELKDLKFRPLWAGSLPSFEVMTSGRHVTSPEDLSGAIIRSTGGTVDRMISEVGAGAISMPIGEMYEAIQRATVEGTLASPISITPYSLEEVITHSTRGAEQGSFTLIYGVNTDTWDRLNDSQQKELLDAADASQESLCLQLNEAKDKAYTAMEDAGVEFEDVSANAAEWEKLVDPVRQGWVDAGEKLDLPTQDVLDEFTAAVDRYDHAAERIARGEKL